MALKTAVTFIVLLPSPTSSSLRSPTLLHSSIERLFASSISLEIRIIGVATTYVGLRANDNRLHLLLW